MKKSDFTLLTNSQLSKLYSFAYAIIPDELQAEQIIIDAYSVFLVREKKFIEGLEYDLKSKLAKTKIKKFIYTNMIGDIFKLGVKRATQLKESTGSPDEFEKFYQLDPTSRAVVYLKEVAKLKYKEIENIVGVEKFLLIEKNV